MAKGNRSVTATAILGALAALFGSVSLTFPFGRDQGIFFYVGREWIQHGAIPYRDVFDHKTPFVYALHALLIALAGEGTWPIRAAELAGVLGTGALVGHVVERRLPAAAPGVVGVAMFATSFFYYGYLPFQDTCNTEIWCALCLAAAWASLARERPGTRHVLAAGAFFGLAIVAKAPAACFAPFFVPSLVAADGPHGRLPRAAMKLATFAAGCIVPVSIMLAYFAASGAWTAMVDVMIRANGYYATEGRVATSFAEVAGETYKALDWFIPYSYIGLAACIAGLGIGRLRGRRDLVWRYGTPLAWTALTYAMVFTQGKFFVYHYAVLVIPFASLAAASYADARSWIASSPRASAVTRLVLPAYVVAALALCLVMTPSDVWLLRAKNDLLWMCGSLTADELHDSFDVPGYIDMPNARRVASWLREHSGPTDNVLVRGYEPEIYAGAKRHYAGRFFWTAALTDPKRAYHREEWLAEDLAAIRANPPRWVVAYGYTDLSIDSAEWFESLGYVRDAEFGPFVILEPSAEDRAAVKR